ncbi:microtubule-associated serine/threonine-protein kinase 3-like [Phyllobates terribilis]|uniref:microtubule-associated serine/threonine-protein kinase 3-like n=1 Tax=Phyllobates terribilis TaxID=111132 RepID=UPI003CCAD6FC
MLIAIASLALTLNEAEEKSTSGELAFFTQLARNVLSILEYPAHSLERLETSEGDSKEGENLNIPDPNISQQGLHIDLIEGITVPAITDGGICETPEIQESASALIRSLTPWRKPCKTDFEPIKLISNGVFGAVHLVRQKDSKQLYAMKKIDKQKLKNPKKLERTFVERDILSFIECPFVVSMLCSFTTLHHLCMIMDYVPGGDCETLIKYNGPIRTTMARMYIAETVLAVEYLHSCGVVHRDVKPENLLITSTGHIKLTDFGLSKLGLMRPTLNIYKAPIGDITREFRDNEVVGTVSYIAPEVILLEGYGRPVDWWSVGITLYKFLVGRVPFGGKTKHETYQSIITDDINWTFDNCTPLPNAQDIIIELLRKDPAHRLGTGGANEIKMHPFLRDLDFDDLLNQKPLFIPDLDSEEDTGYFDPRSKKYKHMDSDKDVTSEKNNDLPESLNFVSSSQRLLKQYNNNTRMMNDEDPKSSGLSPEKKDKFSDKQKESSVSRTGRDNMSFGTLSSKSSSSSSSSWSDEWRSDLSSNLRKQQKPEEEVKEGESRRGSLFRRVISSCRRGLSRAARAIGESCIFGVSHRGSINIKKREKLRNLAP